MFQILDKYSPLEWKIQNKVDTNGQKLKVCYVLLPEKIYNLYLQFLYVTVTWGLM